MKKHISTMITVIVFLTGLSLLLYPTVSNYWNSLHQTKAVANYSDAMEKINQKEKQDAIDAAKAYNETLLSNAGRFTPTEEEMNTYKSLLNADSTGMMGYIEIPEIQCELAVYHTVQRKLHPLCRTFKRNTAPRLIRRQNRHSRHHPDKDSDKSQHKYYVFDLSVNVFLPSILHLLLPLLVLLLFRMVTFLFFFLLSGTPGRYIHCNKTDNKQRNGDACRDNHCIHLCGI